MRTSIALTMLLGYAAVAFSSSPRPARADSFSFAAAMQKNGGDVCWGWGDSGEGAIGAFPDTDNAACATDRIVMPLYWRNFYLSSTNRTVRVRAKRLDSTAQVSCTLYAVGSDGFVDSQDTETLTAVDAYAWLNLTVNSVFSTSTSFVSCSMSGVSWLMNVSYSP